MWAAFKDLLSLAEKKHTQRTLKYRRLNLLLQNKDDEIGLSHFVSFFYSFFFFLLTYRYSWLRIVESQISNFIESYYYYFFSNPSGSDSGRGGAHDSDAE